jgi:hypothetical protein
MRDQLEWELHAVVSSPSCFPCMISTTADRTKQTKSRRRAYGRGLEHRLKSNLSLLQHALHDRATRRGSSDSYRRAAVRYSCVLSLPSLCSSRILQRHISLSCSNSVLHFVPRTDVGTCSLPSCLWSLSPKLSITAKVLPSTYAVPVILIPTPYLPFPQVVKQVRRRRELADIARLRNRASECSEVMAHDSSWNWSLTFRPRR